MIISDRYLIAHIPKTGGDAAKQIAEPLGLPLECVSIEDSEKHGYPSEAELKGRDLILTFRRLPTREISYWNHHFIHHQEFEEHRETLPEWLAEQQNGETWLSKMIDAGKRPVAHIIRMEHLREDLIRVLSKYHKIPIWKKYKSRYTETKKPLPYNHDLSQWMDNRQIAALYRASPLWTELEMKAYGNLLVPLDETPEDRDCPKSNYPT